jgi:hypothetical protein
MRAIRVLAAVLGILLILFGGLFALQGSGLVMWPADSSMLADTSWVLYGGIIFAVGVLLVWWGSRRRLGR